MITVYDLLWPSYLTIRKVTNTTQLHSRNINRLVVPIESDLSRYSASNLFNNLSNDIKLCKDIRLLAVNYANS